MESKQIEIDDLLYSYPQTTLTNFQTLVSSKQEYRKLSATRREPLPIRAEFFLHQRLVHRYLLTYDRLYLFHKTGTGKSSAAGGAAEMFLEAAVNASLPFIKIYMKPQRTHIKQIYVLVRGPTLEQEFISQLRDKISREGKYPSRQSVSANYTITTYSKFAKQVAGRSLNKEFIREKYSGSMFIVDEVHQMIPSENDVLVIDNLEQDLGSKSKKRVDRLKQKTETYEVIKKVFQSIVRSKIVLLSATPMINEPSEIGTLMNLLLPVDNQVPTDINFDQISLAQLEPYLRSRVSYIRELESEVIPVYQGELLPITHRVLGKKYPSQEVVYTTIMSGPSDIFRGQSQGYVEMTTGTRKQRALLSGEQQASLFVFPDGSSGATGFRKYVTETEVKRRILKKDGTFRERIDYVYKASPELLPWLRDMNRLGQLSSKYVEIVSLARDPGENVFIYNNKVKGSGSIVLTLCLEAQGFEKFEETKNIFFKRRPGKIERTGSISKSLRYAFYTSGQTQEFQRNILRTFNSYENRHGAYIKVLIVSEVGGEGINVSNVQQVHIAVPWWNKAQIYQAISRAFRATSHVDLIAEAQEQARLEGRDPSQVRIVVRIFQHLAVLDPKVAAEYPGLKIPSSDERMYVISETKNIRIKRIERMLKQSAFDCQLHYGRNVRGGVDGSAACDYDICNYTCVSPEPSRIDMSSYDILYASETIQGLELLISKLFNKEFYLTYQQLYEKLSDYSQNYIQRALRNLINSKKRIINRFGTSSYLQENSGFLFLSDEYPTKLIGWTSEVYGGAFISTEKRSLEQYIVEQQKLAERRSVQNIGRLDPLSEEFEKAITQISLGSLIELVEQAIISGTNPRLLEKYQDYIWKYTRPAKAIEAARTGIELSADQIRDLTSEEDPQVLIHNLNRLKKTQTGYAASAQISRVVGDLRVYEPNTSFRTATPAEQIVYTLLIEGNLGQRLAEFEQYNVYGIIDQMDPKFKVSAKIFETKDGKRGKARGRVCTSFSIGELVQILDELDIEPDEYVEIDLETMLQTLEAKKIDTENLSEDQIIFMYSWIVSKNKKKQYLCDLIEDELTDLDRILYV